MCMETACVVYKASSTDCKYCDWAVCNNLSLLALVDQEINLISKMQLHLFIC